MKIICYLSNSQFMKVELKKQKVFKDLFLPTKQTIQKTLHLATKNILDIRCVFTTVHNTHLK